MILALVLFFVGLFLSAFFSGSETGFYRATRVRLVLDGLKGGVVAKMLLGLANNPSLFVATTLVGNNVANYLTSLAIVLAARELVGDQQIVEIAGPVLLSPVVFLYGELLPKNLFFLAPNKLLRISGPLFFVFLVLFSPVAGSLWVVGRVLEKWLGESPVRIRLRLARRELAQVLREGEEAGILRPRQHALAQNLSLLVGQNVMHFATPISRAASVTLGSSVKAAQRLARRRRAALIPVLRSADRKLAGYVRTIDLYLRDEPTIESVRPLLEIAHTETCGAALAKMQSSRERLARIVDAGGETIALLFLASLTDPLFKENE